jgi:hypothetical protein
MLQIKVSKFHPGQLVITAEVEATIDLDEVKEALFRHLTGDWGALCIVDKEENERALKHGDRLFSCYYTREGQKFYIITEADRSATTILLPEEY